MDLNFNVQLIENYHSPSQSVRVLTEHWFASNMFCPRCGNAHIRRFENNRPVADFYCDTCNSEYELKSNHNSIDRKITDGAYGTMIHRITENNNPDLFCMRYEKRDNHVTDLIFIPKYFFYAKHHRKKKTVERNCPSSGVDWL